MLRFNLFRLRDASVSLAFFFLLCAPSVAQTPAEASSAKDEPVVELSPFVTTAGSEKGYVATSSLAGSRVNTNLKDIAAQIDVMTPEFLNDIGATNVDDAIAFSTNNGGPTEQNVGPNATITSTRSVGRARGFDAITPSADFYATNLPSDLYNVERLTIANGPQSILFGLGNAGGAIDTSTKRALMRNRGEVGFRVDEFGSFRSTLDLNHQLIPQKLALRFAGVKSDGESTSRMRSIGSFVASARSPGSPHRKPQYGSARSGSSNAPRTPATTSRRIS